MSYYASDSRFQSSVNRFVGSSKGAFLACALGMIAVSVFCLYIAAFDPFEGSSYFAQRYEEDGWVAGPIGILFFGWCFVRGLSARTDADGRVLRPDGTRVADG